MTRNDHGTVSDVESDPFGERTPMLAARQVHLLGGRFRFESNSHELLRLVDSAYAGLPRHRPHDPRADFRIKLLLTSAAKRRVPPGARSGTGRAGPPPLSMLHGAGLLGCATGSSNFVVLSARERAALVVVSPQMLRFPYQTRL